MQPKVLLLCISKNTYNVKQNITKAEKLNFMNIRMFY